MIKNIDDLHFENPSGYEDFLHYRVFSYGTKFFLMD